MTVSLKIVPDNLCWKDFFELPSLSLKSGWQLSSYFPKAYLAVSEQSLFFGLSCPASANIVSSYSANQFVAGLWIKNVAELFIANEAAGAYQEINLSPAGAYWSQYFSSYREVAAVKFTSFQPLAIFAETLEKSWIAGIKIKLQDLSIKFDLNNFYFNITAITGNSNSCYHSLAEVQGNKPDFHLLAHELKGDFSC